LKYFYICSPLCWIWVLSLSFSPVEIWLFILIFNCTKLSLEKCFFLLNTNWLYWKQHCLNMFLFLSLLPSLIRLNWWWRHSKHSCRTCRCQSNKTFFIVIDAMEKISYMVKNLFGVFQMLYFQLSVIYMLNRQILTSVKNLQFLRLPILDKFRLVKFY
jgi:hypothetical protein